MCSPRVLLCRLQMPVRSVLRVLRVLRVLQCLPPPCLWRTDVTSFAFCRSLPRRRKVKRPKKGPRSPQRALQKGVGRAGELLGEGQTVMCTVDDARYAMVVFKN